MAPLAITPAVPAGERAHPIEFVEIHEGAGLDVATATATTTAPIESAPATIESADVAPAPIPLVNEPRWNLWGDLER
jgi:hypothetical protein